MSTIDSVKKNLSN
jgi:hypothetical protein